MSTDREIGATAPVGDVAALAEAITGLDGDRQRLARYAENAARFSAANSMETVFAQRLAHLQALVLERAAPSAP